MTCREGTVGVQVYTFKHFLASDLDGGERSNLHRGQFTPGNNHVKNCTLN
jgi:hypothetical protein